jgi:hypothetical protein
MVLHLFSAILSGSSARACIVDDVASQLYAFAFSGRERDTGKQ